MKVLIDEDNLRFELQAENEDEERFIEKFMDKFFKDTDELRFAYSRYNLSFMVR
jgi:hypothetical protein